MTTEWIKKHVTPGLVARYERELAKLRGEVSSKEHIVSNIKQMNEQLEIEETQEQRRARELAQDAIDEEYFQKNK
jgi:hypothetical protein